MYNLCNIPYESHDLVWFIC